jgi:hypothetical protein
MINITKNLTKSQKRNETKRQTDEQKILLRKQKKAKYRKMKQKTKKNNDNTEYRKPRKLRDFLHNLTRKKIISIQAMNGEPYAIKSRMYGSRTGR